jgi:predicted RNase H-like HicB family nuclease
MKRRVIVYQDETGGWCVLCPSLGAFSQGENREDALANIQELLPAWIEEEFKDQPVPEDDGHIEFVEISLEPHKT